MMQAKAIIEQALAKNVVLYLKEGQLAYVSEEGGFDAELKTLVVQNKAEILLYLNEQAQLKEQAKEASKISKANRNEPLELSFAQQGLWFIDKLEGGSSQYNISTAVKLRGKINLSAMNQALNTLVARHEVLRTVFIEQNAQVFQVIQPASSVPLPIIDISNETDDIQQQQIKALAAQEMAKNFDLATDLMIRGRVLKLAEQVHVVLFTMHHIVSDGWSQAIMINEFVQLYDSYSHQRPVSLPALEIQYCDYAHWQRSYFTEEKISSQVDYWQSRLERAPLRHNVPFDRMRPVQQSFAGLGYTFSLNLDTLNDLKAVAKANDATLFMLLYSAFSVFIGRWSDTTDVVIGSPIAGRTHPQVAPLIGFFLNSIIYRSHWHKQQRFVDLLAQNRQHTLTAYDNQDMPLDSLVDKLKIPRELSHSPLFQMMFTLQNNETSALELSDLSIEPLLMDNAITKYDLQLEAAEFDSELVFGLSYSSTLFNQQTIVQMMDSFTYVLQQLASEPQMTIDKIELQRSNQRPARYVPQENGISLHGLVEQQVRQSPDAIAVSFAACQLTYQQLNAQANVLARQWLAAGFNPPVTTLVYLNNPLDTIVALLSILKLGSSYHYYCAQDQQQLVSDATVISGGCQIVCDQSLTTQMSTMVPTQVQVFGARVNDSADDQGNLDTVVPSSTVAIEQNGLRICHQTAVTQAVAQAELMVLDERSTLLILPPSHLYNATGWLAGLAVGAKLQLGDTHDGLSSILRRHVVSHMMVTPALLARLPFNEDYRLEQIAVTNDVQCQSLLWLWASRYPVLSVLNWHCFDFISCCKVKPQTPINLGTVRENSPMRITNCSGQTLPPGAVGHLWLEAPENQPQSFIDSGLCVRQNNDKSIELLGDEASGSDADVCLAESVISAQANVRQVAIIDGVCFVCIDDLEDETLSRLKAAVKDSLPAYLLPEHYLLVDSLPLFADLKLHKLQLSRQFEHWQDKLKNYPQPEHFKVIVSSRSSIQTLPMDLDNQAAEVLQTLAAKRNISPAFALSGAFVLALSLHTGRTGVLNITEGLSLGLQDLVTKTLYTNYKIDYNQPLKQLFDDILTNLRCSVDFQFVNQPWLVEQYNRINHADIRQLYDHKLLFGDASRHGQNVGLTLQIVTLQSTRIDGNWWFDSAKVTSEQLTVLRNTLNSLIKGLDDKAMLSFTEVKTLLTEDLRSKVRAAKKKFTLGKRR